LKGVKVQRVISTGRHESLHCRACRLACTCRGLQPAGPSRLCKIIIIPSLEGIMKLLRHIGRPHRGVPTKMLVIFIDRSPVGANSVCDPFYNSLLIAVGRLLLQRAKCRPYLPYTYAVFFFPPRAFTSDLPARGRMFLYLSRITRQQE